MPDKGKVERFNHYLQASFYHPLRTRLAQDGLMIDADTANAEVLNWLNTVAHPRVHGTTGKVPAEVLLEEQPHLQALPPPWRKVPEALPANAVTLANMKVRF